MTRSTNSKLDRLADLRRRREDRAREALARGNALLQKALADHERETTLRDRILRNLPVLQDEHLRRAARIAKPEHSLALFISALAEDRAVLARQVLAVNEAADARTAAEYEVQVLRARFLEMSRRREATETLSKLDHDRDLRRQALRDEDSAADQARSHAGEARP